MASLRKTSGNYYARFYDRSRSPQRKTYPLRVSEKRAALRKLTELEQAYEAGRFDPWLGGWLSSDLTLSDAAEQFLSDKRQQGLRPTSLERYGVVLRQLTDVCPAGVRVRDVQASDLKSYVYDSTVSNSTQRNRRRHAKAFFSWAEDEGLVDRNPVDDVKAPRKEDKLPAIFQPEDIERVIQAVDAHREMRQGEPGGNPDDAWLVDLVRVALCTGMRRNEMLYLQWSDVQLGDSDPSGDVGLIHIRNRGDFKNKSGSEATVPLVGDGLEALRERYERLDPLPGDRVFTDSKERAIKPDRASRRFKLYVRKARLARREDLTLHSLRHTCGSWLAAQGVPMTTIRDILRHESTSTTEIYLHTAEGMRTQALKQVFGGNG